MREIWKDVPNYEGYYQASNLGNVRSVDRDVNHWRGGTCFKKGIALKPSVNHKGYKMVGLFINGKGGLKSVHRVIAETFIDNPETLPQVNHIDGNKLNNKIENLEWISNIDNINHSFKIGNHKGSMLGRKGQDHPRNILSDQQIGEIKKLFQEDVKIKKIAEIYNVSYRTISRAIKK